MPFSLDALRQGALHPSVALQVPYQFTRIWRSSWTGGAHMSVELDFLSALAVGSAGSELTLTPLHPAPLD